MADTLPDVILPANEWVDLYAATGIIVGTKINVQNTGAARVRLATSLTEPLSEMGPFIYPDSSIMLQNDDGDTGAWALCKSGGQCFVEIG